MKTSPAPALTARLLAAILLALPLGAAAVQKDGKTDLATTPLSGALAMTVSPNILFVLDDSLSMEWEFLPDWAGGSSRRLYQTRNPSFNGITYNPAVTYAPPSYFDENGNPDTTTYPSQTRVKTGGWKAVCDDGYGIQSVCDDKKPDGKKDIRELAFYYTTIPGEYCTDKTLRSCSTTQNATYPEPALLRWCKTAAAATNAAVTGDCKAIEVDAKIITTTDTGYTFPRMPAPRVGYVTFSGNVDATYKILVAGKQITSSDANASTSALMAKTVAARINDCTFALRGGCEIVGYRAEYSGSSVYIAAPGALPNNTSITATKVSGGTMTVGSSSFGKRTETWPSFDIIIAPNSAPGENLLTVIIPKEADGTDRTYVDPATGKKASTRSDCANADFCTYEEEMTNFANWWAYYRTRMQAMKSATSRAFFPIDEKYRIGYFSLNNNNTGTALDFLNIKEFDGPQKHDWYVKLFSATPYRKDGVVADTPLRIALSNAGRLYAGKLATLNGVAVNDPVQYWCQDNVTILSTDGYWNQGAGFQIDGVSLVGEQDGYDAKGEALEVRPMLDGGIAKYTRSTVQRKMQIVPTLATWNQTKYTQWQVQENIRPTKSVYVQQYQQSDLQVNKGWWQQEEWILQTRTKNASGHLTDYKYSFRTLPLQKREGPLQTRTGKLQKSTFDQMVRKEGHLQADDLKQETRTMQLQRRYNWAQKRTSTDGVHWTSWEDGNVPLGETCLPVNNRVQCRMAGLGGWEDITAAGGANPGPCVKQSGGATTINVGRDNETQEYKTGAECQYVAIAPAGTWKVLDRDDAHCTPTTVSSSAQTLSEINPVECRDATGAWHGYRDVSTCTTSGSQRCMYNLQEVTDPAKIASCLADAIAPSTAPNYTVDYAITCSADNWTKFEDVPAGQTCVEVANKVKCQYDWKADNSDWTAASTCASNNPNGPTATDWHTGGTWTVLNARDCRVNWGNWVTTGDNTGATCTPLDSGGTRRECRYGSWGNFNTPSSTPCSNYSNSNLVNGTYYQQVECSVTGTWVENPACTSNPSNPQCVWGWTSWTPAYNVAASLLSSCTPTTTDDNIAGVPGSNSNPPRQCRYYRVQKETKVESCTPIPLDSASPNKRPNSQTNATGADVTVLSPPSTYTPGLLRYCRSEFDNTNGWVDTSSCTVSAANATQCRYKDWSEWTPGTQTLTPKGDTTIDNNTVTGPAYNVEDRWTDYGNNSGTCVEDATTRCGEAGDPWKAYPYDPNNKPVTDKDGAGKDTSCHTDPVTQVKTCYREEIDMTWASGIDATTGYYPPATSLPTAAVTAAGVPNIAALLRECTPGMGIDTVTGKPNGRVTYCNPLTPNASPVLNVPKCEPVEAAVAPYGVEIKCDPNPANIVTITGTNLTRAQCIPVAPTANNSWTETVCTVSSGSSTPDTLADVAEYYWRTDLRTEALKNCEGALGAGTDVCHNKNKDSWQLMQTFTLGLGASGVMQYQPDYKTATSGDYYSILQGIPPDSTKGTCSWQTILDPCNWPKPETNKQTNIDDLWHTAVNGRGTYFSADNPTAVAAGISTALEQVTAKEGALAEVTLSSPLLDTGTAAFLVSFTSGSWTGDVKRYEIDGSGALKSPETWSARSKLSARPPLCKDAADNAVPNCRQIFTLNASRQWKEFTWENLKDDEVAKYFRKDHINGLTQMCPGGGGGCLATVDQTDEKIGEKNLVNFLRGDRTNEGDGKYYRARDAVLGDIVSSAAVYVQQPPWTYTDRGYLGDTGFKTKYKDRAAMLYAGANDGMLHAFYAETGEEAWAYVPRFILKDLYRLADKKYSVHHRFYVDGTPVMGDACLTAGPQSESTPCTKDEWKTILVGGANGGGQGYYALDITDPADPKPLWEFTDARLGYTYGNPVITKLIDGTWVVLVASGYNNTDGKSRLFVLRAKDGSVLQTIETAEGIGLAKIGAWANYVNYNNTALRVYGGDLEGNLWRFDINGDSITPAGCEKAQNLATLKDAKGNAQPITAPPELGLVQNTPVVFVGTGQLLGDSDKETKGTHTMYAIKDPTPAGCTPSAPRTPVYDNPRTLSTFVEQTMVSAICPSGHKYCEEDQRIVKMTSREKVTWATQDGWYVDFPEEGERVNTTIRLFQGRLLFTTNTPQEGACIAGGMSFFYALDYKNGGSLLEDEDGWVGNHISDSFAAGPTPGVKGDGSTKARIGCDGCQDPANEDVPSLNAALRVRRISWREVISE